MFRLPVAVMKMSAVSTHVVERLDLVAFHRRLQRADRIDLGDDDAAALAAQRLRAALADLAVAEDDRDLAAEHHVGRAVEAVDQRVAAAVDVVELALGDRVVDVDGREEQRAGLHHLVEAVHAGRRLFADAAHRRPRPCVQRLGFAFSSLRSRSRMTPHSSGSFSASNAGTCPAFSNSTPLCTSSVASPPSSTISVGPAAVGPHQRLARAPPVLLERLALPGEDRHALRILRRAAGLRAADDDRRGGVILRREDVARHPAHVGAELGERLDQHGGLHRHVQAAHDARAGERLLALVALARAPSGRASPARRGGSPCGRIRRATGPSP